MALIIKGDMPKACITGKLPNYEYCVCFGTCHHANSGSERPKDCPLVEISDKHGRLVEADEITDAIIESERNGEITGGEAGLFTAIVHNAKTIIPSSIH